MGSSNEESVKKILNFIISKRELDRFHPKLNSILDRIKSFEDPQKRGRFYRLLVRKGISATLDSKKPLNRKTLYNYIYDSENQDPIARGLASSILYDPAVMDRRISNIFYGEEIFPHMLLGSVGEGFIFNDYVDKAFEYSSASRIIFREPAFNIGKDSYNMLDLRFLHDAYYIGLRSYYMRELAFNGTANNIGEQSRCMSNAVFKNVSSEILNNAINGVNFRFTEFSFNIGESSYGLSDIAFWKDATNIGSFSTGMEAVFHGNASVIGHASSGFKGDFMKFLNMKESFTMVGSPPEVNFRNPKQKLKYNFVMKSRFP